MSPNNMPVYYNTFSTCLTFAPTSVCQVGTYHYELRWYYAKDAYPITEDDGYISMELQFIVEAATAAPVTATATTTHSSQLALVGLQPSQPLKLC